MPPGANKNKQRARRNIAYQKLTRLHRKIPDLLLLHCLLLLLLLLLHLLPLLLILDSDHLLLLHLGLLHLSLLHLDLLLLHLDLRDDPLALELDLAAPDVDRGGREHGAAAAATTTVAIAVAVAVAVVVVVLAMATGRPVGGEAAGPAAAVLVVAVGSAVEAGRQTATAERAATGAALHAAAAGAGSPALLVAIEKERHCGGGWLVGGVEDQFNSVVRSVDFYSDSRLRLPQTPLADRSVRRLALLLPRCHYFAVQPPRSRCRRYNRRLGQCGERGGGARTAVGGSGGDTLGSLLA